MSLKKRTHSVTGNHVKITARHKLRRIQKELARIEPLPSARNQVDALQKRIEYWTTLLK